MVHYNPTSVSPLSPSSLYLSPAPPRYEVLFVAYGNYETVARDEIRNIVDKDALAAAKEKAALDERTLLSAPIRIMDDLEMELTLKEKHSRNKADAVAETDETANMTARELRRWKKKQNKLRREEERERLRREWELNQHVKNKNAALGKAGAVVLLM